MAQINLLKQSTQTHSFIDNTPKILARIFLVVLSLLIIYYLWLFFSSKSIDSQTAKATAKINADTQSALNMKNRDEVLTRQQQVKSLAGLISSHVYWSQLFPELARVTLKTASYSSLKVGLNNDLGLTVTVPSLADLDKYMQIFNLASFNQNFSEIRIGGFNKIQGVNSNSVQFQVLMKYSPGLIQYKPGAGGN